MSGQVNTFRATKAGAWRGRGSYSDSLTATAYGREPFGDGWELGTIMRGGHRINVWAYRRKDPGQRIAKIMDADHRWCAVGINDEDWENFQPAGF